jgi:hypothetical protein
MVSGARSVRRKSSRGSSSSLFELFFGVALADAPEVRANEGESKAAWSIFRNRK